MMAEPDLNWPKRGDRVFRGAISPVDRARVEAFIMPSEVRYANGYRRAGDMIVAAAQEDAQSPDDVFFPLAYLYRHHLELSLKGLVALGARHGYVKGCEDILVSHNLHRLWNKARQLIKAFWPDSPDDDLNAQEHMILEFHNLDSSGEAFRYARDKQGRAHLQGAPKCVDLSELKKAVDSVSLFIEAACTEIDYGDPGPSGPCQFRIGPGPCG